MNKAGYIISMVASVLAIVLSILLIAVGPVLTIGPDVGDFYTEYEGEIADMWTTLDEYNGAQPFVEADLEDYIDEHAEIIEDLDARELGKIADRYDSEAFADLADIFEDNEDYLPKLRLGVIGCLIASIVALIGAEIARRFRITGSVMVLAGASLTLIFSLIGGAIVPMAAASVLMMLGGVFQILRPSEKALRKAARVRKKLPVLRAAAYAFGFAGSVLALVSALLMIFTVPLGLLAGTLEDIKDDLDKEHVVALNETALALPESDVDLSSEAAVAAFATDDVASDSTLVTDADVYDDAVAFVYGEASHAAVSMLLVGIAIVLALIAFVGAQISRSAPIGGGIMMLLGALLLVLVAIYTDTLMPMVIAFGLLAVAGIMALAPTRMSAVHTQAIPQDVPQPPNDMLLQDSGETALNDAPLFGSIETAPEDVLLSDSAETTPEDVPFPDDSLSDDD